MPIINVVKQGMTSAAAKETITGTSWQKFGLSVRNQDGEDFDLNPYDDNLLAFYEKYIKPGEKDSLLERKKSNDLNTKLKDSSGRYGEAKEWDHLVLNFGKEETVNLTDEEKVKYKEALMEAFSKNIKEGEENGRRMVFVAEGHDDTGNFHIHILSHRFPVDNTTKWAGVATDIGRHSEAALQAFVINDIFMAMDLEPIDNWINAANRSIYEDRLISDEAKEETSKMIEEAGGQPTLDIRPSATPISAKQHAEQRPQIDPQEELLRKLVESHEREAARLNEAAKKSSQNAAMAQHAIAALQQKREAVFERDQALTELDQTRIESNEKIAGLTHDVEQKAEALNFALDSLDLDTKLLNYIDSSIEPLVPADLKETQDLGSQVAWVSEKTQTASRNISQYLKYICGEKPRVDETWDVFDGRDIASKAGELVYQYDLIETQLQKTSNELAKTQEALDETTEQMGIQGRYIENIEEINAQQGEELTHLAEQTREQANHIEKQEIMIEQQKTALEASTKLQSEILEKLETATKQQQASETLTRQQTELIAQQSAQLKAVTDQFRDQVEAIRSELLLVKQVNVELKQTITETENEFSVTVNELEILRRQSATLSERMEQEIDPDDVDMLDKALKDEMDDDYKPKD